MNYTQLYIGGKWCDASDGGQFAVINPMDESRLADVASGTVTDALAAMDAADAAFKDWRGRSPRARGEILRKAFELFTARLDDFARLITLENGKARSDALDEAGVPPGVVNVLPSRASGAVVSAMLSHPRARVVSFTGSTEVGRKLLHAAADTVIKRKRPVFPA
jgi:acyl-CoA reductase-like NAD-dependent aldehyde dehydrogenase